MRPVALLVLLWTIGCADDSGEMPMGPGTQPPVDREPIGTSPGDGDGEDGAAPVGEAPPPNADGGDGDDGGGGEPSTPGESSGGLEPDSPTARTEACIQYFAAQCERQVECEGGFDSLDDCLRLARLCPDFLFSDGAVRTVQGALDCAAEWLAFECDAIRAQQVPGCVDVGTRPVGAACEFSQQCASGGCAHIGGSDCGQCFARNPLGSPCDLGNDLEGCERGATCNLGPTCMPYVPDQPPNAAKRLGEVCEPPDDPRIRPCGLYACLQDAADGMYRCAPLPGPGEGCIEEEACDPEQGVYCTTQHQCAPLPAAGEPCGATALGERRCAAGSHCDDEARPRVCVPNPGPGELCTLDCAMGYECTCVSVNAPCDETRCLRVRLPGESCDGPGDECIENATRCVDGTCQAVEDLQGLFEAACDGG